MTDQLFMLMVRLSVLISTLQSALFDVYLFQQPSMTYQAILWTIVHVNTLITAIILLKFNDYVRCLSAQTVFMGFVLYTILVPLSIYIIIMNDFPRSLLVGPVFQFTMNTLVYASVTQDDV